MVGFFAAVLGEEDSISSHNVLIYMIFLIPYRHRYPQKYPQIAI